MKTLTMALALMACLTSFANENCKISLKTGSQTFYIGGTAVSDLHDKGYDVSESFKASEAKYKIDTFVGHSTSLLGIKHTANISIYKVIKNSQNEVSYKQIYSKGSYGSELTYGARTRAKRKLRRFIKKLKDCR